MEYFRHERVSDRIIRIIDITDTAIYLVTGNEKACLIDTGSGIGSLRDYVDKLTDLPYDVILTHGHVDHASGAAEFQDKKIYLHAADRVLMKRHTVFKNRTDYTKHVKHIDIPEKDLIPQMDPNQCEELCDGDVFDLGGLHLQIVHTPGHTNGMCMVLIKEERTILFGDGCGVSVLIIDDDATSVETYLKTLISLRKYNGEYDKIIRNHGTYVSKKSLLESVISCAEDIIDKTDDHYPAEGLPGNCTDAFFARKVDEHKQRIDGKEGNIAYRNCKIFD